MSIYLCGKWLTQIAKKYAVFVKFACKPDACLTSVRTKISCISFHSEMVPDIYVLVKRENISPMYEG